MIVSALLTFCLNGWPRLGRNWKKIDALIPYSNKCLWIFNPSNLRGDMIVYTCNNKSGQHRLIRYQMYWVVYPAISSQFTTQPCRCKKYSLAREIIMLLWSSMRDSKEEGVKYTTGRFVANSSIRPYPCQGRCGPKVICYPSDNGIRDWLLSSEHLVCTTALACCHIVVLLVKRLWSARVCGVVLPWRTSRLRGTSARAEMLANGVV